MNTDNENKSEELNESELDSVAGGFSHTDTGDLGDGDNNDNHANPEEGGEDGGPHNPEDDAPDHGGPIHV